MRKKQSFLCSKKALLLCLLIPTTIFHGCSNQNVASTSTTVNEGTKQEDSTESTVVFTLNDTNVSMDKMLYYITYYESLGAYQAEYNEYYYGLTDYWDSTDENGQTMRDRLKNTALESAIRFEILANEASKSGLALSKEEIAENQSNALDFLSQLTEEQTAQCGITQSGIASALDTISLAKKYSDVMKENLTIDESTLTNEIKKEDYIEYETEYLYLPTVTYDKEMKAIENTEEEKKQHLSIMNQALELATSGFSFAEIKTTMTDVSSFTTTTRNFKKDSENVETAYKEAAMNLANGELSKVVKGEYGYYLIKMLNTASTKSYDTAIEEATTSAKNAAYNQTYEELKQGYQITTNHEFWDSLSMGTISLIMQKEDVTTEK